ncbi:D-erythronate dehydrogenase [Ferrovibrio sp.]|uniref:D-erythronate dehydrogenase n=1 Tax=Ferrovibrio sp. TaxID=1917215 RepID=UPI0035B028A5
MVNVVITGGAGFIGQALAKALLQRGQLTGPDGQPRDIQRLSLFDAVAPNDFGDPRVEALVGDVGDQAEMRMLIGQDTDSVFHLAAVVSSGAEADFDLGYRTNLAGTRNLLEACRAQEGLITRVVFASSVAVYGGALPDPVTDSTPQRPTTSYGAQKLMGELMVNDYTRKGYIDGRSVRLPTIMIRPGKPNKAASTWASSIVREPLSGVDAICPVTPESVMVCLSPRRTVDALIRLHDMPGEALGPDRALLLNGISATAREIADAMARNAGNRKIGRIDWQPDAATQRIVDGWPRALSSARARSLGFGIDRDIDEIVRFFIEDDLDAQIATVQATA